MQSNLILYNMKNSELNLMVIQNFIDYYTSNEDERDAMKDSAWDYIQEDRVDGKGNPDDSKPSHVRVIQLTNENGSHEALYTTMRNDTNKFQEVFNECLRKSEMAAEQWADGDLPEEEQDDIETALENYLSEEGFYRHRAEEVWLNEI